jgi:hypothetical protein
MKVITSGVILPRVSAASITLIWDPTPAILTNLCIANASHAAFDRLGGIT